MGTATTIRSWLPRAVVKRTPVPLKVSLTPARIPSGPFLSSVLARAKYASGR